MADRSGASPWINALDARWNRFALWWGAGLNETVPAAWTRWLLGPATSGVVIEHTADGCVCRAAASADRRAAPTIAPAGADALAAYLTQAGSRRDEVTVGLCLDRSLFLTRDLDVPDAALEALPRLLDQEILRRTPFGLADVMHGAVPRSNDARRGVTQVRHWIIRRDIVDEALRSAGLDLTAIDVLLTRDDEGRDVAAIRIGPARAKKRPSAGRGLGLAAGLACLGTVLALVAVDQAQEREAEHLTTALADVRARAHGSNGVLDAVGLLTIQSDVGMSAILNDLSNAIPDDTFLTELRIADGKVEAAGFSADAARLVRLVDASPVLKSAALAGAIELNAAEGKDHFTIRADLRTGQMFRLHALTGGPRAPRAEDAPS